jgi:hypothetical protein
MTLPEEAQVRFLRTIKGLENVDMLHPGDVVMLFVDFDSQVMGLSMIMSIQNSSSTRWRLD